MPKDKGYVMVTVGFAEKMDEEDVRQEIKNYIRRIRSYRETHGMKKRLEYCHTEYEWTDVGSYGSYVGVVIMAGMNEEDAERLWKKGGAVALRINTSTITPHDLALSMCLYQPNPDKWTSSKGMKSRYLNRVLTYLRAEVTV